MRRIDLGEFKQVAVRDIHVFGLLFLLLLLGLSSAPPSARSGSEATVTTVISCSIVPCLFIASTL
jgi:hypothetical protein